MKPGRPPPLTVAQQLLNLRGDPSVPGEGTLRRGGLTWRCDLQPTPLSRTYKVRIDYQQGKTPQVFVDHPNLVDLAGGKPLPHVYDQSPTRLCLYMPAYEEWHGGMLLSRTVVQWAMLWFFFFEEWLASGEWKGGGEHPPAAPEKPQRKPRTRCARPAQPRRSSPAIEATT